MEVISSFFPVIEVLSSSAAAIILFAVESLSLSDEPSKLYDTTNSWKPLLKPGQSFLRILDIPLFPGEPTRVIRQDTNIDRQNELRNLPTQEMHTIRVCFVECSSDDTGRSYLDMTSFPGSPAMISQWGLFPNQFYWETHSNGLSLRRTLIEKSTKINEHRYIDSVSIAAGTVRQTLECKIVSDEDGPITFYINATSMILDLDLIFDQKHLKGHKVDTDLVGLAYEHHNQFCHSLQKSIEAYSILGAQVTPVSGLKQQIHLCYIHAFVDDYVKLVYCLQTNYARQKEGLSDPRRATLTIPMLAEITRDICFYEEVKERVAEVAGAVDAVVESLKILLVDTANYRDFQCIAVELQSTCTDLKRTIATLSTKLEDHLRLFELSRGMHEAQNVRLLSILASIFLPLSLASGLLSMQTRFSDLHYLIYDFFGVLVLLGTIVAVILLALTFYLWWQRLLAQLDRNRMFRKNVRPIANFFFFCFLVFGWGLLISSFLIGMIKDVGLGLTILGYGASVAVGVGVLVLIIPTGIAVVFYFKT